MALRKRGDKTLIDLCEQRKAKGYTQERLANEAGVVRQTISEIERGVNNPSIQLAQKIAKILEFNWSEFFEGNE